MTLNEETVVIDPDDLNELREQSETIEELSETVDEQAEIIEQLRVAVAALRHERAVQEKIIKKVADALEYGVLVARWVDGSIKFTGVNVVARRLLGDQADGLEEISGIEEWAETLGPWLDAEGNQLNPEHLPLTRAMHGIETPWEPLVAHGRVLNVRAVCIGRGEHAIGIALFYDINRGRP